MEATVDSINLRNYLSASQVERKSEWNQAITEFRQDANKASETFEKMKLGQHVSYEFGKEITLEKFIPLNSSDPYYSEYFQDDKLSEKGFETLTCLWRTLQITKITTKVFPHLAKNENNAVQKKFGIYFFDFLFKKFSEANQLESSSIKKFFDKILTGQFKSQAEKETGLLTSPNIGLQPRFPRMIPSSSGAFSVQPYTENSLETLDDEISPEEFEALGEKLCSIVDKAVEQQTTLRGTATTIRENARTISNQSGALRDLENHAENHANNLAETNVETTAVQAQLDAMRAEQKQQTLILQQIDQDLNNTNTKADNAQAAIDQIKIDTKNKNKADIEAELANLKTTIDNLQIDYDVLFKKNRSKVHPMDLCNGGLVATIFGGAFAGAGGLLWFELGVTSLIVPGGPGAIIGLAGIGLFTAAGVINSQKKKLKKQMKLLGQKILKLQSNYKIKKEEFDRL